jgi:hypothetical protein
VLVGELGVLRSVDRTGGVVDGLARGIGGVHAVAVGEGADAGLRLRIGEVGEDLAGVDRGELVRITDEHERHRRRQGIEERVHQLEIDHRGLVDDHRAHR